MKSILAIGVAAAALMGASSAANAQECINGWKMIKDQVPVMCDAGLPSAFSGPGPVEEPFLAPSEEPLYTGSIAPTGPLPGESEQPPVPTDRYQFAASRSECVPGQYWMLELDSGDRPVAC